MSKNPYKIVDPKLPHFVTCTVLHRIPVFTDPATVDIILESLRFLQQGGLAVYAYVILENHMHLVVQSEQLDADMARFKSQTATQLIQYFNQPQVTQVLEQLAFYKKALEEGGEGGADQFWQEGLHAEWIQNDAMMQQKIEYTHQNPVIRGYVDKMEHWRYSSARNYYGEDGLLDIRRLW